MNVVGDQEAPGPLYRGTVAREVGPSFTPWCRMSSFTIQESLPIGAAGAPAGPQGFGDLPGAPGSGVGAQWGVGVTHRSPGPARDTPGTLSPPRAAAAQPARLDASRGGRQLERPLSPGTGS